MDYQLAEELWGCVLQRKIRIPFVLEQIEISTGGAAHFYIKSSYAPEHISSIFRKCGALHISTSRMSNTTRTVTVRGFNRKTA